MSQNDNETVESEQDKTQKTKPITFKSALLKLEPVEGMVNYCIYCAQHYLEPAPANVLIECPNCEREFRVLHPAQ